MSDELRLPFNPNIPDPEQESEAHPNLDAYGPASVDELNDPEFWAELVAADPTPEEWQASVAGYEGLIK